MTRSIAGYSNSPLFIIELKCSCYENVVAGRHARFPAVTIAIEGSIIKRNGTVPERIGATPFCSDAPAFSDVRGTFGRISSLAVEVRLPIPQNGLGTHSVRTGRPLISPAEPASGSAR